MTIKNKRRFLALFLAIAMLMSFTAITTADESEPEPEIETEGEGEEEEPEPDPEAVEIFRETGSLETRTSENIHTFTLEKPGRVSFVFERQNVNNVTMGWNVTLRSADDNVILIPNIDARANAVTTNSFHNYLPAGTYHIRVASRSTSISNQFSNAEYSVAVNFTENIGQFETEFNNDAESASPMTVNKPITGNIWAQNDVDWYELTIPEAGRVSITFARQNVNNANMGWNVTLRSADDNVIFIQNMDVRANAATTTSHHNFLSAGTYRVRVAARSATASNQWSRSDYTITVNFEASGGRFETEFNNDMASASPMTVGQPIIGNLWEANDVDWFEFELENPGRVSFTFERPNINNTVPGWNVTLRGADNTILIPNIDARADAASSTSLHNFLPAGTYYIRVAARSATLSNQWSRADYSITVNYEENEGQFETEFNNDMESANTINTDSPVTANLWEARDEDWFKFTLTEGSQISLTFERPNLNNSTAGWNVTLRSADNVILIQNMDARANSVSTTSQQVHLAAGTYYVRVAARSATLSGQWNNSDYTLTVNQNSTTQKLGDVDGNGIIQIVDALEILKFLAGLQSLLVTDTTGTAMTAARITVEAPANPTINCVLEILKYLAGLPNKL
jgi:general stress protein 26